MKYNLKNKHKYFLIIIIVFCGKINLPQNRWQFINPKPTGFNLYSADIDSQHKIWLTGEYGTLLKSDENFYSWETIDLNYTENLYDVEMIQDKMWIVGESGLILFSNDQGLTFNRQVSNTTESLVEIQFFDENHGWIMAKNNSILRTEDGGMNWQKVQINSFFSQNDINFLNNDDGFLLAGNYTGPNLGVEASSGGKFFKTNDGGKNWVEVDSGSTKYSSIFFFDDQIGYMAIHNSKTGAFLLKSTDSGNNWDTLSNQYPWDKILFIDEQNGFAVYANLLEKTTDGGQNWEILTDINTPSMSSRLTSILPYNQNILVVGTEGSILSSKDFGNNWERLDSSIDFYYASLQGVTFTNQNKGYIYGDQYLEFPNHKPIFLTTLDAGKSWNSLPSPDSSYINVLKEYNNILWASCSTKLYRSINGGTNWSEILDVANNNDAFIRDIFLFDNNNIIVLAGRRVYHSLDGGNNWSHSEEFGVTYLKRFVRITQNKWVILGHNAISEPNYITENAGVTWNELSNKFTSMQFITDNIGYAIDSSLFKTTNGGNTWELINQSVKNIAYWTSQLVFYNESIGWLKSGGFLYYTSDGGITWAKEYGVKGVLYWFGSELSIISKTEAWAVGSNGHIFKLTLDETSSLEYEYAKIPQGAHLYQNYPNPFNPTTRIMFYIPFSGQITLKVYDLLGREVSVLLNEYMAAGYHYITMNGKKLSSGVYYYNLTINNYSITKKLLLLK